MSNEERIRKILAATPEQLEAVDSALGCGKQAELPRLRLYRMGEAAKTMGLSRTTLWRAVKEGRLRAVEVRAGSYRIPESELRRLASGVQA